MPRLAETRIVVLALVERNLRNVLPRYPLAAWPGEAAAREAAEAAAGAAP